MSNNLLNPSGGTGYNAPGFGGPSTGGGGGGGLGLGGLTGSGIDPQDQAIMTGTQRLEMQTSMDQLAQLNVNMRNQAITTANTIRQQIASTMEGIMNQAISLASQFVGDEISQAKKGLENAGKAV
jgi:hypothetical protein